MSVTQVVEQLLLIALLIAEVCTVTVFVVFVSVKAYCEIGEILHHPKKKKRQPKKKDNNDGEGRHEG